MKRIGLLLEFSALGLALVGAYVAGGSHLTEKRATEPAPLAKALAAPSSSAVKGQPPSGGAPRRTDAIAVTSRLNDLVSAADVSVPNARAGLAALGSHWRKMTGPWVKPSGAASGLVLSLALRTSDKEEQWTVPLAGRPAWTPDAHVWNMNEGSFDQREVLFAPTPASFGFNIVVPKSGHLSVSPAVVMGARGATVFEVTVRDALHVDHTVFTRRIEPDETRRWFDEDIDLGAFADQSVELRLSTAFDPHALRQAKDRKAPGADGGLPPEPDTSGLALAAWGTPVVRGERAAVVPYNVLWIVIDALRADVISSLHEDGEDEAKRAAKHAPLEALLPNVPGLMPNIDAVGHAGVRFTHAYSAGSWTRPGTVAMLSGARTTELGVDPLLWVVPPYELSRFYSSDPPLLPLRLRREGVMTRAFVNNFFMTGYSLVGLDFGFERIVDHRYRTRDTDEITRDTVAWLTANRASRFFVFANYNSPHDPYDPPERMRSRVPPPPAGPSDPTTRLYMAEAAKDDEAVGKLMATLRDLGIASHTLVVITADHGETLSSAHAGSSGLEHMPIRYHHAASNYEETTHIPIVLLLPDALPAGRAVRERVRNTDIAPTLLELEGLERSPRMSGRSLLPLVRGEKEADSRVVVTEGRGTRSIIHGKYRYLEREGAARTTYFGEKAVTVADELFDLESDPGERHNLAVEQKPVLDEMKARLKAARANVPVAGTQAAVEPSSGDTFSFRFATKGRPHRISGTIEFGPRTGGLESPAPLGIAAVGTSPDGLKLAGSVVSLSFTTSPDVAVGFDVSSVPSAATVSFHLFEDDAAWPDGMLFGGPYGVSSAAFAHGIDTEDARALLDANHPPFIDAERDFGLFVTRNRHGAATGLELGLSGAGKSEMEKVLKDWGYSHGSGNGNK